MASVRHLGLLPSCIKPVTVLPGTEIGAVYYVLGVDLPTLLKWYWRIKTWSVSASVTSSSFFTPGTVTYEQTFTANDRQPGVPGVQNPQNEKDLVCQRRTFFNETEDPLGPFNFELFGDGVSTTVEFYQDLYYPLLNIGFDGGNGGVITTLSGLGSSGGTITIDGLTVPSFLYPNTSTGSIIIEPAEYWPYNPGDGKGPIYDSATGAQLRGFPS
jgi:hypothetical protein